MEKTVEQVNSILDNTEKIQKECLFFIDDIKRIKKFDSLSYNSLMEIFFMLKISELQEEIKSLNEKLKILSNNR